MRSARQQHFQAATRRLIKRPVQIGAEEKEIDAGVKRSRDGVRRLDIAETERADA